MTIQIIDYIARLTRLNNINPNANYNNFKQDWQKCFRILLYLYLIYGEGENPLEIKQKPPDPKSITKNNRESTKDISNNYFQTTDFYYSIKSHLETEFDTENKKQIHEINVRSIINFCFSNQESINPENISHRFSLTESNAQDLLALTPFNVASRTINNDLDTLSKIVLGGGKFIIEVKDKKYRKKPVKNKKEQPRKKIIKLLEETFHQEEKTSQDQDKECLTYFYLIKQNQDQEEYLTHFYLIKHLLKKLLKIKYNSQNASALTEEEIKILTQDSLRLCLETILIYPQIFGEKYPDNKINSVQIQKHLNSFLPKNEEEFLTILKINEEQFKNWVNSLFPTFKKQPKKNESNERLKLIFKKYLLTIENVEEKTISKDFDTLVELDIISVNKFYGINNNLSLEQILSNDNDKGNLSEENDLLTTFQDIYFDDLLSQISNYFKGQKRFFIKFQHINEGITKLEHIVEELRKFWENNNNQLMLIKYASSSQETEAEYLIYPITLFYNQRGIYLVGYGEKPLGESWELDYYNFRLDHLCKQNENKYIIPVEWCENNNRIDPIFFDNKDEIQSQDSQSIYSELSLALGVDTHRNIKTMLLRFPQKFHKNYIESSRRHATFKQIKFNDLGEFWEGLKNNNRYTKITEDDQKLIRKTLEKYPQDAYYTMNYRHGEEGGYNVESDVIMRLRAWCPNVEVLLPADLRKRMREDMQKTWDLYQNDE